MKWKCEVHNIEVIVEKNTREFKGLSWSGTPQCQLFTMSEYKEGEHAQCYIKKIE